MKDRFSLLLLSLVILSACSHDESLNERRGTAVTFKTFVSPQGRGVAALQDANANLQQNFGVFVYRNAAGEASSSTTPNALYNEKVTYTPGAGFDYAGTIYWPVNEKLGFYAYSPYYTDVTSSGITDFVPDNNTTPGFPGFTFSVHNAVDEQIDLLVAKTQGLSGGIVALPFVHALSKVEVQAHTSAVNYRVAIMGVRFGGINSIGNYRFVNTGDVWNGQNTEVEYFPSLLFNGNSKPNGTGVPAVIIPYSTNAGNYTAVTDPNNALYLLPQTLGANAQLTITYNIYNEQSGNLITALESQDLTVDIGDPDATLIGLVKWEKSRRIIYRINFVPRESGPGSEVKFEATVTEWSVDLGDLN